MIIMNIIKVEGQELLFEFPQPDEDIWRAEASPVPGEEAAWLLPLIVEVFPVIPPVSSEGIEFQRFNVRFSVCHGNMSHPGDCALIAASSDLPSWDMFGYFHVDSVVVEYPTSERPVQTPALADWAEAQRSWAGQNLGVLQFRGLPMMIVIVVLIVIIVIIVIVVIIVIIVGLRVSFRLGTDSSLRVVAPPGYGFGSLGAGDAAAFNESSALLENLPALDLLLCRVLRGAEAETAGAPGGEVLVLRFVADLNGDQLFGLTLAVSSPDIAVLSSGQGAGADASEPWRLETRTEAGEILDIQGDVGSWGRAEPFNFALLAATTVAAPGHYFNLAVLFRMPESGLGQSFSVVSDPGAVSGVVAADMRTSLQLEAPATFEFQHCLGGAADNEKLSAVPAVWSLQDPRVLPALLRALPDYSACAAQGSSLSAINYF